MSAGRPGGPMPRPPDNSLTRRQDKRQFRNRICILRSIDRHEVEALTDLQWERLRRDPYLGYLRLDDHGEEVVWRAILKRERPT